jgi:hypothetical protein
VARIRVYGDVFRRWVAGMGISEVVSALSSPWQNPYAERLIGSLRRECLDHVIILSQGHLRRACLRAMSIMGREPISPSRRTRPRHDGFKRRRKSACWRSRKLVDFTIGTSDAQPDAIPPVANAWHSLSRESCA